MTDEGIKELYVLVIAAWNDGQQGPPVYLFPARLTGENLAQLKQQYAAGKPKPAGFWDNLKEGYDRFAATHRELRVVERERGYVFL